MLFVLLFDTIGGKPVRIRLRFMSRRAGLPFSSVNGWVQTSLCLLEKLNPIFVLYIRFYVVIRPFFVFFSQLLLENV